MAIFADRVFKDESERIKHQRRIEEIKKRSAGIPKAAPSAYIPVGAIDGSTIPMLIISGIKGSIFGAIIAAATSLICVGIFIAFAKLGSCADVLYALAALGYFLSPAFIGSIAGNIIGKDCKGAKCRSPILAFFIAFLFGLLASVVTYFYIEPLLVSFVHKFWVYTTSGEFNSLPRSMRVGIGRIIMSGVILLINITVGPLIAYSKVKSQKFCEDCMNYLTENIIARIATNNTQNLLLGLLEKESNYLTNLPLLDTTVNWKTYKECNDIVHSTCSCGNTNFIDVICHWVQKGKEQQFNRLLFSEKFTSQEVENLKKIFQGK